MSYPKYLEYKNSGLEWLGKIPAHWRIVRLKFIVSKIGSGKTPSGGAENYISSGIPLIRSQNVRFEGLFLEDVVFIDKDIDKQMANSRTFSGDVLLNITGASIGRCCIVPSFIHQANVNQHVCVIRPLSGQNNRFLKLFLESESGQAQVFISQEGISREGLTFEQIGNFFISFPSLSEQCLIADFLDSETARLDKLIGAKERLLDLLTEKRRALITQAVTRGLNADAPMRDSGVEWLGEVPKHWQVVRLKYLGQIFYGIGQPPEYRLEGVPFIRATNIERGKINSNGLVFVDYADLPESRVIKLKTDDIIVVRSGAYTGDSAIISNEWENAIAGFDMILRLYKSVFAKFISFCLLSGYVLDAQIDTMSNRAAQSHLNAEELGSVTIVLPPFVEQQGIVDYIKTETKKLDMLKAATERTISLLKERRASLIAAAVTGQIAVGEQV